MPKHSRQQDTYTLEISEEQLCHLLQLVLREAQSPEPGPTYRHKLHILAEELRRLAGNSEAAEDVWFDMVEDQV